MGYRVDFDKMNDILDIWSETYHMFAPVWDQRKKKVRYREIRNIDHFLQRKRIIRCHRRCFILLIQK